MLSVDRLGEITEVDSENRDCVECYLSENGFFRGFSRSFHMSSHLTNGIKKSILI